MGDKRVSNEQAHQWQYSGIMRLQRMQTWFHTSEWLATFAELLKSSCFCLSDSSDSSDVDPDLLFYLHDYSNLQICGQVLCDCSILVHASSHFHQPLTSNFHLHKWLMFISLGLCLQDNLMVIFEKEYCFHIFCHSFFSIEGISSIKSLKSCVIWFSDKFESNL